MLDDLVEGANYPYLLSVFSGNLAQGQTSAYVGIKIHGDVQDSGVSYVLWTLVTHIAFPASIASIIRPQAHLLSHEGRKLSDTYDDWFVLYTPGPLGELQSVDLWTDCAGVRPYWYCEKVVVEELRTGRSWTFPAFCWLSLEHGTRRACVTLRPTPLKVKHRFFGLLKASARGDHTWASVCFRWVE